MICNFSDLLIYNMNGTKGLCKFFHKKLLSYYFIKIINLAHIQVGTKKIYYLIEIINLSSINL